MNRFVEQVFICMVMLFILSMFIDGALEHVTGEPEPGLVSIVIAGMLGVNAVDHMRKGYGFIETMALSAIGIGTALVCILLVF